MQKVSFDVTSRREPKADHITTTVLFGRAAFHIVHLILNELW